MWYYMVKRDFQGEIQLGFFIAIMVLIIMISCLSIEGNMKKQAQQQKELIELLQEIKEKL